MKLDESNVTDLRFTIESLCKIQDDLNALELAFQTQAPTPHKHPAIDVLIGPGAGTWSGKTQQEFDNYLASLGNDDVFDALIYPEVYTNSGKLNSVGALVWHAAEASGGSGTFVALTPTTERPASAS